MSDSETGNESPVGKQRKSQTGERTRNKSQTREPRIKSDWEPGIKVRPAAAAAAAFAATFATVNESARVFFFLKLTSFLVSNAT
jgi:hypothetical protein